VKTLVLFVLALSAPAAAFDSTPAAPQTAAPAAAEPAAEPNRPPEPEERLICRRTQHTGQRTASRRVCRTAAHWREIDR